MVEILKRCGADVTRKMRDGPARPTSSDVRVAMLRSGHHRPAPRPTTTTCSDKLQMLTFDGKASGAVVDRRSPPRRRAGSCWWLDGPRKPPGALTSCVASLERSLCAFAGYSHPGSWPQQAPYACPSSRPAAPSSSPPSSIGRHRRSPPRRSDLPRLRRTSASNTRAHGRASGRLGVCRRSVVDSFSARGLEGRVRPQLADLRLQAEARARDIDASLAWLGAQSFVDARRLAIMGYSYGGGVAMLRALSARSRTTAAPSPARAADPGSIPDCALADALGAETRRPPADPVRHGRVDDWTPPVAV